VRTTLGVLAIPFVGGLALGGIALLLGLSGWPARAQPPRQVAEPDLRPAFPGAPTRPVEALCLLRARNIHTLTRAIEERQRQTELDIRSERRTAGVHVAFDTADPTVTPLVDEWVATTPASLGAIP
jgi:hypothetical protein